jgi:hypothetical protein
LAIDIAPADEVECYALSVVERGGLLATTRDEQGGCAGEGLRLRLFDDAGEQVGNGMAIPARPCAVLEAEVGVGEHTLCVERSPFFPGEQLDRRVRVELLPVIDNSTCDAGALVAAAPGAATTVDGHTFSADAAWYRVQVEQAGLVELELTTHTAGFDGEVRVMSACGGDVVQVGGEGVTRLDAAAGEMVVVVQGVEPGDQGRFELGVRHAAVVPGGDSCASARALPAASGALLGDQQGMTDTYQPDPMCTGAGTYDCAPTASLADAVYSFRLEPGEVLHAFVDGMNEDSDEILYVLSGDACGAEACLTIGDTTVGDQSGQPSGEQVEVANDGSVARDYLLVVDACSTIAPAVGAFVLEWQTL